MLQQTIQTNIRRFSNFLGFARNFLVKKNPIKAFFVEVLKIVKDMFSITKKKKMAQYRLGYQMHKLNQMEQLIAQNNEHTFLRGQNFNEMR